MSCDVKQRYGLKLCMLAMVLALATAVEHPKPEQYVSCPSLSSRLSAPGCPCSAGIVADAGRHNNRQCPAGYRCSPSIKAAADLVFPASAATPSDAVDSETGYCVPCLLGKTMISHADI